MRLLCRLGIHRPWMDTNGHISVTRCDCGWVDDPVMARRLEMSRRRADFDRAHPYDWTGHR